MPLNEFKEEEEDDDDESYEGYRATLTRTSRRKQNLEFHRGKCVKGPADNKRKTSPVATSPNQDTRGDIPLWRSDSKSSSFSDTRRVGQIHLLKH